MELSYEYEEIKIDRFSLKNKKRHVNILFIANVHRVVIQKFGEIVIYGIVRVLMQNIVAQTGICRIGQSKCVQIRDGSFLPMK